MNVRILSWFFLFFLSSSVCFGAETRKSQPSGNPVEDLLNATIFSLGEIRVSNSRVSTGHSDETATEVARNITVIGPREISESGAGDLPGVLSHKEGVPLSDETGMGENARLDLRGFGGE